MTELSNISKLEKSVSSLAKSIKEMATDFKSMESSAGAVAKVTGGGAKDFGTSGSKNQMPSSLAKFGGAAVAKATAAAAKFAPRAAEAALNGAQKALSAGSRMFNQTEMNEKYYADRNNALGGAAGPVRPGAQFSAGYNRNVDILNNRRDLYMRATSGVSLDRWNSMSSTEQKIAQGGFYGPSDSIKLFQGLTKGFNQFLPGVEKTMNYATGYYNAGVYGGTNRKQVQSQTFNILGGMNGISSAGADARVAQFLGARGMTAGSETYNETLRTVGNAAKYMNISNEEAAASVEGLTNASGAASMLQNFGIYTADLNTGKEKTQGEIFEELAQRLTAGRGKASVEQTQASIRRGALGVTVDSFFKGDQQGAQMFKQYMIDRAGGKATDLSKGITDAAADNPLASQYRMATSDTRAMGQAGDSYIKGIDSATKALTALNVAAGGLASSFMGVTGAMQQTLFGHDTMKGLMGMGETTVDFASKGISSVMQALMQAGPMTPLAPAVASAVGISAAASLGGAAAMYLGTAGAANVGGGTSPLSGGGFAAGTGDGASPLSGGGFGSADAAERNALALSQPAFDTSLVRRKVNKGYGLTDDTHPNGHGGIDYNYKYGEPVRAMGDGVVIHARKDHPQQDSTGNSYGNNVIIKHTVGSDTYTSTYAHLSKVTVSKKDQVTKGQIIGYAGNSGHTVPLASPGNKHAGTHLHFEFRKGSTGNGAWVGLTNASHILRSGKYDSHGYEDPNTSADDGGTSSSDGSALEDLMSSFTMGAEDVTKAGQMDAASQAAFNNLAGLFSGDANKVLNSVGSMAGNLGVKDTYNSIMAAPSSSANFIAGNSGYSSPAEKPQVNNSVVINVSTDASMGDAIKFGQYVKQYLDENSVLSNTGGN